MLISNLQYTLIPIYQYTSNLQKENNSLPFILVDSTHLMSGHKGNIISFVWLGKHYGSSTTWPRINQWWSLFKRKSRNDYNKVLISLNAEQQVPTSSFAMQLHHQTPSPCINRCKLFSCKITLHNNLHKKRLLYKEAFWFSLL